MMRRAMLLGLLLAARAAAAQNPVVLATRLGGDSAQATSVELRAGATYRVEVRPRHAEVVIRERSRNGAASQPAVTMPLLPGDTAPEGVRAFRILARSTATHFVELTNPQVGPTGVRISLLERAATDSVVAAGGIRTLVFSDVISNTPIFIDLDSGKVYRITVDDVVYLAPRAAYQAPVRIAPLVRGGGFGGAFIPEFSGSYRLWTDPGSTAAVHIFLEAADPQEMACIRRPGGPGCRGTSTDPHRRGKLTTTAKVMLFAVPAMILGILISGRG